MIELNISWMFPYFLQVIIGFLGFAVSFLWGFFLLTVYDKIDYAAKFMCYLIILWTLIMIATNFIKVV